MDPQTSITSSKQDLLKQKFEILKQLTERNWRDYEAHTKPRPDWNRNLTMWQQICNKRIKKINREIDMDVEWGNFGRQSEYTDPNYTLLELEPKKSKHLDDILEFFGEHYPRDRITVKGDDPIYITYKPFD